MYTCMYASMYYNNVCVMRVHVYMERDASVVVHALLQCVCVCARVQISADVNSSVAKHLRTVAKTDIRTYMWLLFVGTSCS